MAATQAAKPRRLKVGHSQAGMIKLYAELKGCALRTAQLHRNQGHPDWVEFAKTGKVPGAAAVVPEESAPAVREADPMSALYVERFEEIKDPFARRAKVCQAAYDLALSRGRQDEITFTSTELSKALEMLRKQRVAEPKIGREMGELVEWSRVIPAVERMHLSMAESTVEHILKAMQEVAPEVPERELRPIAENHRDELFRLLSPERLREACLAK